MKQSHVGPVRSYSSIKNTITCTLVGLMEAVSKPRTHLEKLKQAAILVEEANRKAVGALYQEGN